MSTSAITNLNYVPPTSSAEYFEGPAMDLNLPLQAVNYQFVWGTGVIGVFRFEARIFPNEWETLVNCEEVKFRAEGIAGSVLIGLLGPWMSVGHIRFTWTPDPTSTGNFKVAQRIVPT
jgi:hypothetical protein